MFSSKILMLTTRFFENRFQSIMLRTTFSKKYSGTFFYESHFWTFLKCPFLKSPWRMAEILKIVTENFFKVRVFFKKNKKRYHILKN
jgi:hypothetical protein